MKKLILIVAVIFYSLFIFATPVSSDKAKQVAYSFLFQKHSEKQEQGIFTLQLFQTIQSEKSLYPALYIYNIDSKGFIIISGDDAAYPILAYSFSNVYGTEDIPIQMTSMLNSFVEQINLIRSSDIKATKEITQSWNNLSSGIINNPDKATSVTPLLTCLWNQGSLYNALCPEDPEGPAGRVYAGCVATMMGMTMYYYRHPNVGIGSHGYNSPYGYLSVDFSQSTYNYEQMPSKLVYGNYDVAKLLYDCGVAIDMNYSPYGSGAYMSTTLAAMKQYFGYNPLSTLDYKDNYSESGWKSLLKAQLDAGYPLPYAGYDVSSGHAFVCDGYDGDWFHFNWGWGGSYNGYFYISNLNPGYNFSTGQQAYINCYPASVSYPQACGNYTMNTRSGSVASGYGTSGYMNDQSCTWHINPSDSVSEINFEFKKLMTESATDTISVYEGSDANAPLVGTFSGNSIPPNFTVSGEEAFITFKSNATITDQGFLIDYFGNIPVYCSNLSILNNPSGIISDGSNSYPYINNSMCRWKINPDNAVAIQFDFTEFELEDNQDFLYFYDNSGATYVLMQTLSGGNIPQSFFINSSNIMVLFKSNDSNTEAGFKFNYHALATGINEVSNLSVYIYTEDQIQFLQTSGFPQDYYEIIIRDISGRIIASKSININKDIQKISLPLNNIVSGIYFCTIANSNFQKTLKFYK